MFLCTRGSRNNNYDIPAMYICGMSERRNNNYDIPDMLETYLWYISGILTITMTFRICTRGIVPTSDIPDMYQR